MSDAEYVIWKECYSVNDSTLDDEHRQILADINKLYLPMQGHAPGLAAERLLDRLIHSMRTHFLHEEERLKEIVFDDLPLHKALHDNMLQWIERLKSQLMSMVAHDAMDFIKKWWLDHLENEDKKYAAYISGIRVWSNKRLAK